MRCDLAAMEDGGTAVEALRDAAFPLEGAAAAEQLMERIPEGADWVLIGESSHGTHEFYQLRAEVTKLLIEQRGYNAVATEADFPDAMRVNNWCQHLSDRDDTASDALADFARFPTWMWRNQEVVSFLQWLHAHNAGVPSEEARARSVGWYGMDIYSLSSSTEAVIGFLEEVDPDAAKRARERYGCFDKNGADAVSYAFSLAKGSTDCEADAVGQLVDLLKKVGERKVKVEGKLAEEEASFAAVSNARVVKGAEEYFRSLFFAEHLTWNIRDKHMAETAEHLAEHLKSRDIQRPKIVVWAHNSHLGDARHTCMGRRRGEVNLGQLLRDRYGEDKVCIIGQMGHTGELTATAEWGAPVQHMKLTPAIPESHEALLHQVGLPVYGLDLANASSELADALEQSRLQRSCGIIYQNTDPEIEKRSHYFTAWLRRQFDLLVFHDVTSATAPLETGIESTDGGGGGGDAGDGHEAGGGPGTFPFGT